jgi:phytoene dehydrogenase-like protein
LKDYDSIIIGAGHNGLICATYLAKKGQQVLLLEASKSTGGLATTSEFYPGFKTSVAQTISHFSTEIVKELNLSKHGFNIDAQPMSTMGLHPKGENVVLSGFGKGSKLSGVGEDDIAKFSEYRSLLQRFAEMLKPFWLKTIPRVGSNNLPDVMTFAKLGLKLRLLGKKDMGEFMRVAMLPARDLMDENFDNDILKAILSWDGLVGSKMAPRSPNATVMAMLYKQSGPYDGAHSIPPGGINSLIQALEGAALEAGVEIKTDARVKRITIEGNENGLKATGVELLNGETYQAKTVVSSADPKRTFIDLVGVENLEIGFTNRIQRLRTDGFVAKLHLALSGIPKFKGIDKPDTRMIIAPNLDAIEFAFDDAKYGNCSQNPVMDVVIPSLHDKSQAPEGQQVLSANLMYVPYKLKGGWNEQAKEAIRERAIDTLAEYAPDIRDLIIHAELLTPFDLEQQYNVTGGHWHHAELSIDQMFMMRPTYEAAQYKTPIPGLFLCGAGSHPGGGLMGGPGHNAACEILK